MKSREYRKTMAKISKSLRNFETALENYSADDKNKLQELKNVADLFNEWAIIIDICPKLFFDCLNIRR